MASYWFRSLKTGAKVTATSIQAISRLAQKEADEFGRQVQVMAGEMGRKSHRKAPVKRNPVKRKTTKTTAHGMWVVTGTKNGRKKTVKCENIGKASAARRAMLAGGYYPVSMKRPA